MRLFPLDRGGPRSPKHSNTGGRDLVAVLDRCGSFVQPGLTVATVRQWNAYRDVFDAKLMPGDLKDVQRPWVIEALLRLAPPPARVLEFGGARCEVADFLAALGYEVCVVDPYDGSSGGSKIDDLNEYAAKHPGVRLVRGYFSDDIALPEKQFDVIYSVSVVEHCEVEGFKQIARGLRRWLAPDGYAINAIDWNFGPFLRNSNALTNFLSFLGIESDLARLERDALADPGTFYLSPEAHRRWRDFIPGRAYGDYPYRRSVSLQQITPAREVALPPSVRETTL